MIFLLLFVHSLIHLLENYGMGPGLFFLRFFAVNESLGQNLDFFNHIFPFELDELGFVSGILRTVLF